MANIAKGKKRVLITVTAEPWERLQAKAKSAGLPQNWLSTEIDRFVPGLLAVVEQAEKDALDRREMTEAEAMARYAELMTQQMMKKE